MKIVNKELLNKYRVLTLPSYNDKIDYLVVNCGRSSTIIMGIKKNLHTDDIVFIKELFNKTFKEAVEEVKCICNEFYIKTVLIDEYGVSQGFYDEFISNINDNNICKIKIEIKQIAGVNNNYIVSKLKNDIENSKIRFVQAYSLTKTAYNESFLGYSQVMEVHRETDKLIDEFENIEVTEVEEGDFKINTIRTALGVDRFKTLMIYYSYKYNYSNKIIRESPTLGI